MALIPVSAQTVKLVAGEHAYQPVHGTRPFEWLPYFDVQLQSSSTVTEVATIIAPVADRAEAEQLHESLQLQKSSDRLEVTFQYKGTTFRHRFQKNAQGSWSRTDS